MPSFLDPCSIVRSYEAIVSTFAQQLEEGGTFSFMTESVLFVAEVVSWDKNKYNSHVSPLEE